MRVISCLMPSSMCVVAWVVYAIDWVFVVAFCLALCGRGREDDVLLREEDFVIFCELRS